MGITRPTGEQLRFRSATTGDHILDTYMENSEKGSRTLPDLMDDLFDSSGVFRSANFEFRFNSTDDKIQFRAGNFSNGNTGWTDVTTFFDITGTFNASTTYNNFDLLTLTNKDVYIVHGLSSGTTFADEAAVIASANTQKLVDVSEAKDWASKTDGQVVSTDYSSKAYAVGGTGVDTTTGSAKDWAIKTSSTVGNTGEYSAKYWATSTSVTTVSSGIANINTVAAAIASVNTTAANISNVNTVAGISADVTTVANIDGNVSTVAGISANTTTVAGIASNVTTVAGVATNVTTVAGIASNVTTVANNNANVTTVATNVADLQTVADEIDNNNLQTVANDIAAVITAADDLNEATSEIDTVANSIANVDLVGGSIANVNTVATNIANVNTTATNIANVNTVAGISANVTTVAGISADVTTAATNTANITTVAGISGNVTTVAGISSNVTTVAGIAADVTTAATNITAFNNTYLGAQSSAPTLDPDGSALDVGDLYFDTTSNTMKVYAQSGWVAAGSSVNGTADRFNYTATAGQTTFTGNDANGNTLAYDAGFLDVYMNGVKLVSSSDFTATNGTSIVLASAAALNDIIEIIAYGTFTLSTHYTKTQSDARYVQVAGDTMTGNLDVGGTVTADGLKLDAANSEAVIGNNASYQGKIKYNDVLGEFEFRNTYDTTLRGYAFYRGSTDKTSLRLDGNGDISFFDASDNAKFFWDASAESLGIGDTNPTNGYLTIRGASTSGTANGHIMLTGDGATVGEGPQIAFSESGGASNWVGASIGFERTGGGGIGDLILSTRRSTGDANTVATEAMRIDSSQRVLMGAGTDATSTITNGWWNGSTLYSGILNIQNVNDGTAQKYVSLAVSRHSNDVESGQLGFAKSRGSTANSKTTVGNGDTLGLITFQGADGSNLVEAARISAATDNTASGDDMPGRLQFYTTADGAASPTERMRIDSGGNATFKTGGMNLKFPYNSSTSYSGNLGWQHLQLGNNGANRIIAGNTSAGGDFEFVVNNTVDLSSNNSISHNGLVAMIINSGGEVEMHTPNSGIGLYINNTNHDSIVQIQASAANKNSVIRFADGDDADVGMIDYDHADNTMDITTNALTNGLEISSTKGRHSWKTFENWGSGNYNMTMAPGTVFQRKGTIADDIKIRVFQGGYTYSGGSIEFVIRRSGGSQVSVGSGVIYFNGREAENNHVIVGYNDSNQIVVNSDTYAGTYADGKFTFAIRGTSGDSHISIMNRLGSEVHLALKFNILYTG